MPRIKSQRLKLKLSTCSYITSLCYYFLYNKYQQIGKNAPNLKEKRKKNAPFLAFGKKKRTKKPPHKPIGLCRGENKKKNICVSYIWSILKACKTSERRLSRFESAFK